MNAHFIVFVGLFGLLGCASSYEETRRPYGVQLPSCATAATIGLTVTSAEETPKFTNLRTDRRNAAYWLIKERGFELSVSTGPLEIWPEGRPGPTGEGSGTALAAWSIAVRVDESNGRIHGVSTPTPGTSVRLEERQGHPWALVTVIAPMMCPVVKGNEKIVLQFALDTPTGAASVPVEIDDRCIVGDVVTDLLHDAASEAGFVEGYMSDPVIDALVERSASIKVTTVAAEVALLRSMLGSDYRYVSDPSSFTPWGWFGEAYSLSPTQTVRFGGDCEDWNILAAAYLARRGIRVAFAVGFGHAWLRAGEKLEDEVDLVNNKPNGEFEQLAEVRTETWRK